MKAPVLPSPGQVEALRRYLAGCSTAAIADELHLTRLGVSARLRAAAQRLGLRSSRDRRALGEAYRAALLAELAALDEALSERRKP